MSSDDVTTPRRSGRKRNTVIPYNIRDENSDDTKSDDDSDFEMARTPKKKTSPSKKNNRKNKNNTIKNQTKSKRRKKNKSNNNNDEVLEENDEMNNNDGDIDDNCMYSLLKEGKQSAKSLIKSWLLRYKEDSNEALLEFTNFILNSCGCTTAITEDDLENDDPRELIDHLAENMTQIVNDYPLVTKKKGFRSFQQRYGQVFSELVKQSQSISLIDDDENDMISQIIEWLIDISKTGLLSFRHTSSLAIYEIMDALVDVANGLEVEQERVSKKLHDETDKVRRNDRKIKQFQGDMRDVVRRIKIIQKILLECFHGVIVHRFRDTEADLRALTLTYLGQFIAKYPQYFLEDDFTKYSGWCLSDRSVKARKAALDSVAKLYKSEENTTKLASFTDRFMSRFVEMTHDVDPRVAEDAVKLMVLLLKQKQLNEEDGGDVPCLMWDSDERVAEAAAAFVYEDLFAIVDDENESENTDDMSSEQKKKQHKADIFEFLEMYETYSVKIDKNSNEVDHSLAMKQAIHVMYEHLECLKDWRTIVDLLISNNSNNNNNDDNENIMNDDNDDDDEQLTNEQQTILAWLLYYSIEEATEDETIDLNEIESFFKSIFVDMLTVFQTDHLTLIPLIQLLRSIPSNNNTNIQQNKVYTKLVESLKNISQRHSDELLLQQISKSLRYLCCGGSNYKSGHNENENTAPLVRNGITYIQELAAELMEQIKDCCEIYIASDELEENDEIRLNLSARRLSHLSRQIQIDMFEFTNEMDICLVNLIKHNHHSDIIKELCSICMQDTIWCFSRITDWNNINNEQIQSIVDKLQLFYGHCETILTNDNLNEIHMKIIQMCSDMFVLFTEHLQSTPIKAIYVSPSNKLVNTLREILQNYINEGDENSLHQVLPVYARMIVRNHNVLASVASVFLSCFLQFDTICDDIIKEFISKLRQSDDRIVLKLCFETLKFLYTEKDDKHVKHIASRFVFKFPMDTRKRSFLPFIKYCVDYAMTEQPKNFKFLTCAANPFVKRCSKYDAVKALEYVETYDDIFGASDGDRDKNWQHLDRFLLDLNRKADKVKKTGKTPIKKRTINNENNNNNENDSINYLLMSPGESSMVQTPSKSKLSNKRNKNTRSMNMDETSPPKRRKLDMNVSEDSSDFDDNSQSNNTTSVHEIQRTTTRRVRNR